MNKACKILELFGSQNDIKYSVSDPLKICNDILTVIKNLSDATTFFQQCFDITYSYPNQTFKDITSLISWKIKQLKPIVEVILHKYLTQINNTIQTRIVHVDTVSIDVSRINDFDTIRNLLINNIINDLPNNYTDYQKYLTLEQVQLLNDIDNYNDYRIIQHKLNRPSFNDILGGTIIKKNQSPEEIHIIRACKELKIPNEYWNYFINKKTIINIFNKITNI